MKKLVLSCLILCLIAMPVLAEENVLDPKKTGYAIGMNIGMNIKKQDIDVDKEQIVAGLKDSLLGEKTMIDEQEMAVLLGVLQQTMQQKQNEQAAAMLAENAKMADEFLAENRKKEGVKTLPSGLQYKVIIEGKGAMPKAESTVEVHYKGTLIDGTEFDSSYKRGEPASFPVGGVIPGWTEALQLMKEGSKWELSIPPALAYGERGAPPVIPPNAALVFEVELVKIKQ